MAKYTVFYRGQLELECDEAPDCIYTGAHLRVDTETGVCWYRFVAWGKSTQINANQVPDKYKAICLLLNLSI